MNETIKKLFDDARCDAESYAMACVRTTHAKRSLDDALHEENRRKSKMDRAIKALAEATPEPSKSDE